MAQVFTISAERPFVDDLAAGILDRCGGDPLALTAVTVLLPTRRACRSLSEAFLRVGGGRVLLLPRLLPIGDLDAEALDLTLESLPDLAASLDLPPPISSARRQLLLTRAVLKVQGLAATTAQAAQLAADLARLLDQVQTERLGFERLATLVPEDHAEHWRATLQFLTLLTEVWPQMLAAEGAMDAALYRDHLLRAQAEAWRRAPPLGPVIAAGSTGSIPGTAELLAAVANLPNGAVVLPGLDQDGDQASWQAIEEGHPQYNLARLLERLEVEREAVPAWWQPGRDRLSGAEAVILAGRVARRRLVAEALRPAATTEGWRELAALGAESLDGLTQDGLTRIDCPTAQEEAVVVALLLRQVLETPEATGFLVTPDRDLARRVAAVLGRWGVEIDDSAGCPLTETAVGSFLRLTVALAAGGGEPLDLLALAKHPLTAGGGPPAEFRFLARAVERTALRGPRPGEGLAGIRTALMAQGTQNQALLDWVTRVEVLIAPLVRALSERTPLAELLRVHVAVAESLAESDDSSGADRLWRRDDGEAAAVLWSELFNAALGFPDLPGRDYPALFEILAAAAVVRPRHGRHPRLSILGPLEARMVHADLVVLGGLNEGTWPAEPAPDPWLSRPMRRTFGLPAPERRIGLSAHDFQQLAAAPRVVLTRAVRVEGSPSVPSRWLSRLETVLRALGLDGRIDQGAAQWLTWARALDEPALVRPWPAPEPRPPVAARPTRLSVTQIETWRRDPYAIYARHILKLEKLEPIAADPGAAERGEFIHQALDRFVRAYPGLLPDDALESLLGSGREAFGALLAQPDVWAFWWPRFERIAAWFVAVERGRRVAIRPLLTETEGEMVVRADGVKPFRLKARADRIDRLADGALMVIDYKTGSVPRLAEIELGYAPQLPLEAAIAMAGGFAGIAAGARVERLAFWRLSGGDPPGEEKPVKGDVAQLAIEALAGLKRLIIAFADPTTPYRSQPDAAYAPRYTDYAHLARVQEWSAGVGEE
ncbi:ATP-dependent helicase/nuclease subunit B [uncultured Gammaproteobacteria bacterium]